MPKITQATLTNDRTTSSEIWTGIQDLYINLEIPDGGRAVSLHLWLPSIFLVDCGVPRGEVVVGEIGIFSDQTLICKTQVALRGNAANYSVMVPITVALTDKFPEGILSLEASWRVERGPGKIRMRADSESVALLQAIVWGAGTTINGGGTHMTTQDQTNPCNGAV